MKCLLLAVATAAALAVVPSGLAAGGGSIAGAVQVQPGQTYFGNTSQAPIVDGLHWEFWKVDLLAGDHVTFDWKDTDGAANNFAFWTPAANDYNFHQSPTIENISNSGMGGGAGSQELTFTASGGSGVYPFTFFTDNGCLFCMGETGPYQFVFYVKHQLTVSLAPLAKVRRNGRVTAHVQGGDAKPYSGTERFALYGRLHGGKYVLLARSTARGGVLTFHIKLRRSYAGKTLTLLVLHGAGASYDEARSLARPVHVTN